MNKHLLRLLLITVASSFFMSSIFANPVYQDSHAYSYSVEPHYQPPHRTYVYPDYSPSYGYSDYGYNDHSVEYIEYDHAPTIIFETYRGGLHY